MELFIVFAVYLVKSLILNEVPELREWLSNQSQSFDCCQLCRFVFTSFQKVSFQQVLGQPLLFKFFIFSVRLEWIYLLIFVFVRNDPVELLDNCSHKNVLLLRLDETVEEIINHRHIHTLAYVKVLFNGQIQDNLNLINLNFFFQMIFGLTHNPQYKIDIWVNLLAQNFVDKGELSLIRIGNEDDWVVTRVEKVGNGLFIVNGWQFSDGQIIDLQTLDDHRNLISNDQQMKFFMIRLVTENTRQCDQFQRSQSIRPQVRIPHLIHCLCQVLVIVNHVIDARQFGHWSLFKTYIS